MPVKYVKASLRHLSLLTKILLILLIMVMSGTAAFVFRMQKGPVDMDFARERLQDALSDRAEGYDVEIGDAILTWPSLRESILIELSDVKIIQEDMTGLSVGRLSLGLSGLHLLRGKLLPSVLVVDSPTFQLTHEDGSLNLFWREKNESAEKSDAEKPQDENERSPREVRRAVGDFLEKITNPEKNELYALAALKRIELKNVVITGQDKEDGTPHHIALLNLSLKKNSVGLHGDLTVSLSGEDEIVSGLQSDLIYRREQKDVTFTADINNINLSRFAYLFPEQSMLNNLDLDFNGNVQAAFDDNLRLQLADLQVNVPEGNVVIPGVYDTPLPLKDLSLNAYLNRPKNQLEVRKLEAVVADIPVNGKSIGSIERGKIRMPLEITIPKVAMNDVQKLLPESEKESSAGQWLTVKLKEGVLRNSVFTGDLHMIRDFETKQRDMNFENPRFSFDFDGLTVKYSDTLMPVINAAGSGLYENDSLIITGNKGKIGDINGRDINLKMTDLSVEGGGLADINLKGKGPLKTALKYMAADPIHIDEKLDFEIEQVKGNLDFELQLNFPTVKDLPKEEVVVSLDGKVTDLTLPGVVKGMSLTGGPYDLDYKDGAVTLKGSGQLDGRAIDVDWFQYFDSEGKDFESKITAKITADEGLRKTFGIGLDDYISGPIPVDVAYVDKGAIETVDVTGDLTPTKLQIKPFKYNKSAGVNGDLSLKVLLKNNELQEVDNLKLTTKDFSLDNARILFRKYSNGETDISRGSLPSVKLGKTDVAVDFEVSTDNVLFANAKGPIVDIAPFIGSDKKPESWSKPKEELDRPMKISVDAQKLSAHEGEMLGDSQIYFEINKQSDITRIEMDSQFGGSNMYLRFKPEAESGKRTFRLESTDAGYTLKAFGLYDKMRGGKLLIYGAPHGENLRGNLYGKAQIEDFRVRDAPALAKLISALSLQGVDNLLKNEGLVFKKLESDFEWLFRDEGNLLVMKDGRTSGSSLGLTFEGVVNQGSSTMDMTGTVIPMQAVNSIIGEIPLIGDILTGGDALFAATYTMKGPAKDPRVSINPLSVLAPGFLRKILFEGDVDNKVRREETRR